MPRARQLSIVNNGNVIFDNIKYSKIEMSEPSPTVSIFLISFIQHILPFHKSYNILTEMTTFNGNMSEGLTYHHLFYSNIYNLVYSHFSFSIVKIKSPLLPNSYKLLHLVDIIHLPKKNSQQNYNLEWSDNSWNFWTTEGSNCSENYTGRNVLEYW